MTQYAVQYTLENPQPGEPVVYLLPQFFWSEQDALDTGTFEAGLPGGFIEVFASRPYQELNKARLKRACVGTIEVVEVTQLMRDLEGPTHAAGPTLNLEKDLDRLAAHFKEPCDESAYGIARILYRYWGSTGSEYVRVMEYIRSREQSFWKGHKEGKPPLEGFEGDYEVFYRTNRHDKFDEERAHTISQEKHRYCEVCHSPNVASFSDRDNLRCKEHKA